MSDVPLVEIVEGRPPAPVPPTGGGVAGRPHRWRELAAAGPGTFGELDTTGARSVLRRYWDACRTPGGAATRGVSMPQVITHCRAGRHLPGAGPSRRDPRRPRRRAGRLASGGPPHHQWGVARPHPRRGSTTSPPNPVNVSGHRTRLLADRDGEAYGGTLRPSRDRHAVAELAGQPESPAVERQCRRQAVA